MHMIAKAHGAEQIIEIDVSNKAIKKAQESHEYYQFK